MEITWAITNLDRRTSDGFVTTAHWTVTAVDGEYSASIYSTCGWSEGQPVIPYPELTEQQVLGWCWDNGVDKQAAEQAVTAQLEAQKNPPVSSGIPWAV